MSLTLYVAMRANTRWPNRYRRMFAWSKESLLMAINETFDRRTFTKGVRNPDWNDENVHEDFRITPVPVTFNRAGILKLLNELEDH